MGSAIQAGEWPIRIDQAKDKCNTSLFPASIVDESCEDVACVIVLGC